MCSQVFCKVTFGCHGYVIHRPCLVLSLCGPMLSRTLEAVWNKPAFKIPQDGMRCTFGQTGGAGHFEKKCRGLHCGCCTVIHLAVRIAADGFELWFSSLRRQFPTVRLCQRQWGGRVRIKNRVWGTWGIKEKGEKRLKRWLPLPVRAKKSEGWRVPLSSGGEPERNWGKDREKESFQSRRRLPHRRRAAIGIYPSHTQCTSLFSLHSIYTESKIQSLR